MFLIKIWLKNFFLAKFFHPNSCCVSLYGYLYRELRIQTTTQSKRVVFKKKKKGGVCTYPGEQESTWLTDTRRASSSAHVIAPRGRERHNDYESGVIRVPVSKRSQQSGSLYKITQYLSVHTVS